MRIASLTLAVFLATGSLAFGAPGPAGAAPVTDPDSLLPPDGFAPGWTRSGSVSRYRGAELYGHINGGAEVFLELGFEQLVVQEYAAGEDELAVEVYAMSDHVAAAGTYLFKCGEEQRHPGIPGRHSFTPRQVLMYRGNVYLVIYDVGGSEAGTGAMVTAAAAIVRRLPDEEPLPLTDLLPAAGRVERSLRIARGQFSLEKVFTLGEGDVLSLGGTTPAVSADYRDEDGGTFTRIVTAYADETAAQAAFAHLVASLDPAISLISTKPSWAVFQDWAGKYGEAALSDGRIEIRVGLAAKP